MESLESLLKQEESLHQAREKHHPSSREHTELQWRLEHVCRKIVEHPDHHANVAQTFDDVTDGIALVVQSLDTMIQMLAQLQDVLRGMAERRNAE